MSIAHLWLYPSFFYNSPTEYIQGQKKQGECICPLSWRRRLQLCVMVDRIKEGQRAPPSSTAWSDFTLLMKCTPLPLCVLYGSPSASICVERAANIRKTRIPKCLHIIKKGGEAGIVDAFVYMRVFTYVHCTCIFGARVVPISYARNIRINISNSSNDVNKGQSSYF